MNPILPSIDILKMNLDEAGSVWLGQSAEVVADPPRLSDEELRGLAHHCLDRGVGAVCVTLDDRGCVAFYRDGAGGVAGEFVDRIEVEHVVVTTGAGDSFAGGLAYGAGDRSHRRLCWAHAEPVEWVHLRRGRPAVGDREGG